jgi:hypothetical protein
MTSLNDHDLLENWLKMLLIYAIALLTFSANCHDGNSQHFAIVNFVNE